MATNWPRLSIAECAADEPYSTQIGPFGKALTPDEYTQTGVPLLRGVNVNHGRFHDDGYVFISEETANRLAKFESFPGDVLLVHKGTLGQIGLMPKNRKYRRYIMGNSMLRVRCNTTKLLPEFLYYWLCSHEGQHYLFSRVSQVGVPQIQRPLTTLREAILPVPPLSEQKAIAQILGALDDKIELNRQMNVTLEAMAQTLFRAWFIDFEPVMAKADGTRSFPFMPQEVFDELPHRFANSATGQIPEGWRLGVFADVACNTRQTVDPGEAQADTPYIGLEHMPRRSIALSEWGRADGLQSGKFRFQRGEILFGKLRAYFHKVGVAPIDGVCSTDILVIHPQEPDWFGLVLGYCSSDDFVRYADARSSGTKMPRTNWQDMARYQIALPPIGVATAFSNAIRPMLDTIVANIHESRTLAEIRDTLLPKLMSGEVRVPNAERSVGRAI